MNTSQFIGIPGMLFPDQEILAFEGKRMTYGELVDRIKRLASSLRDQGIQAGDRVAILQTNCIQYIEAYYATATLGATFVPLNYRAKPPELEYMITAANTKILFIGDRYIDQVSQLKPNLGCVENTSRSRRGVTTCCTTTILSNRVRLTSRKPK